MSALDILNIDTNNRDEVKSLQRKLKAQGYYNGPIDGDFGGGTTAAATQFRNDETAKIEKQRQQQNAQADRDLKAAQAKSEQAKAEAEKLRAEQKIAENDPVNRLTKLGTELAPYAVGLPLGLVTSAGITKSLKENDKRIVKDVNRIAKSKTVDPQVAQKSLGDLKSGRNRTRLAALAGIPAIALGASALTKNIAENFDDPGARDIINSIATGEQALAMGALVGQAKDQIKTPSPISQADISEIESKVKSKSKSPEFDDLDKRARALEQSMTREQLKTQLKKNKLSTVGLKSDLAKRLAGASKALGVVTAKVAPLAAGAFVGDQLMQAATNQAQAATGVSENTLLKAVNGLGAPLGAAATLAAPIARNALVRAAGPIGVGVAIKDVADFMMQPKLGGQFEPKSNKPPITNPDELNMIEYLNGLDREAEQRASMTHQR